MADNKKIYECQGVLNMEAQINGKFVVEWVLLSERGKDFMFKVTPYEYIKMLEEGLISDVSRVEI